jgi:hypothetical protein
VGGRIQLALGPGAGQPTTSRALSLPERQSSSSQQGERERGTGNASRVMVTDQRKEED